MKPIRKAVFPVAGLGTRFLPATKAMPKEMLTVVDRPVIQHVVDEARAAGIEQFIFVTGRNKAIIEDHFDRSFELERTLQSKGRMEDLARLAGLQPKAGCASFTRQQEPLGLGHAVWCARELVGDEPFALLLPDVITQCPGNGCMAQLMRAYDSIGGNLIATERVDPAEAHAYGIVDAVPGSSALRRVRGLVEKPARGTAPSNLMIMGRYILQPEIFPLLEHVERGAGNEIQLTDALQMLIQQQSMHGVEYTGRSFDCGSKVGFLAANLALGLADPSVHEAFRDKIVDLIPEAGIDTMRLIFGAMHGAMRGCSARTAA